MANALSICFIGFGEAARAFTRSLRECMAIRVTAYDIAQDDPGASALRQAAHELDVTLAADPVSAASGARLVFSAVTASESLKAVEPLAGHLHAGQVLADINSVTAARKRQTAGLLRPGGAAYVDMAVMAPVHPAGHRTPLLLAGDLDEALLTLLREAGFRFEIAGPEAGDATAVKMVRSLFVKGLEAITVQALAAAEASGCHARILESLSKSYPGLGWPEHATYCAERVATHGVRRAAEMREVAATMADLNLPEGAGLANAIADFQSAVGSAGLSLPEGGQAISATISAALRQR